MKASQPLWRQLLALVGSRLFGLILAWIVIAIVGFIPRGFDTYWFLWSNYDFQLYLSYLFQYFVNAFQGDFGTIHSGQTVLEAVARVTPRSLLLLTAGLIWALVVGFIAGILSVSIRGRSARNTVMVSSFFALSIPDFFIIVIVQTMTLYLFRTMAITLLPALGYVSPAGMILPVLTIGILPAAYVTRTVAISAEELEHEDFVRTAIGKGLSRLQAFFHHVLKNIISITLSVIPSVYGIMISSLVLVEYLYVYPGLGRMILSTFRRQGQMYPECEALVASGVVLAGIYFFVDITVTLLRLWVDPRMRGDSGA